MTGGKTFTAAVVDVGKISGGHDEILTGSGDGVSEFSEGIGGGFGLMKGEGIQHFRFDFRIANGFNIFTREGRYDNGAVGNGVGNDTGGGAVLCRFGVSHWIKTGRETANRMKGWRVARAGRPKRMAHAAALNRAKRVRWTARRLKMCFNFMMDFLST